MEYYLQIVLKPDAEMPLNRLMNATYTKLHKALVDVSADSIGVSFPDYSVTLGRTLRLHSNESDLANLQQKSWLGDMSGYCQVSTIQMIPNNVQYRTVSRKQTTMTQAKLERLIKRGSLSEGKVKQYRAKMFTKGLTEPYLELTSGSNRNKHRRYIAFGELLASPVKGAFDTFGLAKTATVPWF